MAGVAFPLRFYHLVKVRENIQVGGDSILRGAEQEAKCEQPQIQQLKKSYGTGGVGGVFEAVKCCHMWVSIKVLL